MPPVKSYSRFIFDSYSFSPEEKKIELRYGLDDEVKFTETILFPPHVTLVKVDPSTLDRALRALHLIGGISYFKTCLPKEIEIRTRPLTEDQAEFWNAVYENGLGEFFYKNDIDFRGLIRFPADAKEEDAASRGVSTPSKRARVLVPVGGGKDSTVTMELLRKTDADITLWRMGRHPFIDLFAEETGLPLLSMERRLSPELFKLNEQGALNGHVPITAYLSFASVVTALLTGHNAVSLSNERSADEGNVEFHGMEINHQWSKSLAFETMFQAYVGRWITPDVAYFSLLRPLSELAITALCIREEHMLEHITSCNANWRIYKTPGDKQWCGACPKCAFAFALFAAFLPRERVAAMFDKDLFDDGALLPLYRELLGISGHKPFECVGTPEETAAAFAIIRKRGDFAGTAAMKMYEEELKIKPTDAQIDALFAPSGEHAIPAPFDTIIASLPPLR